MRLLALDLGTNAGWALTTSRGRIVSGVQPFKPGRYDGGGMRYLRFSRWLDELVVLYPFERVAFEEVRRHVSTDAAHVYGGLLATLTSWCEGRDLPYEGIPVGAIKKAATGKGNATKTEVLDAMRARGHKPADDNEGDALALLHYLLEQASA